MADKKEHKLDRLVAQAQNGDAEAFASVYDELVTPIYRYIYYRVDEAIAEDLTEETFFKAWQNLFKYKKGRFPFTAWIFKIAHNLVADHYRKHQPVAELTDNHMAEASSPEHPIRKIELKLNSFTLHKAIRRLRPIHQQIILLKYINELPNETIAEVTGKTVGAIRLIQFRALKELKELIGDKRDDF